MSIPWTPDEHPVSRAVGINQFLDAWDPFLATQPSGEAFEAVQLSEGMSRADADAIHATHGSKPTLP